MCELGALTLTCAGRRLGRKAHGLLHGLVTEGTPCLCLQAWTCLGGRVEALLEAWGTVGSGDFGGHGQLGKHRLLIPRSSPLPLRGLGPME